MEVTPRAEHVWVDVTGVWGELAMPGLLLGWRQHPRHGWQGYVIAVRPGHHQSGDGPYVNQMWIPASSIRPLGSAPPRAASTV